MAHSTYYVSAGPNSCGHAASISPWNATTLAGTIPAVVPSCEADSTYTISYTVTNSSGVQASSTILFIVGHLPPKASLTVNGQSGTINVTPGQAVTFEWTSSGGTSASSTYYVSAGPNGCGHAASIAPWNATTLAGSIFAVVPECEADSTYTISYTVTNRSGEKASSTILFIVGHLPPKASLTANGQGTILIAPGQGVTFAWTSSGGTSATSSYYVSAGPNGCGHAASPAAWNANSLNGSIFAVVPACESGSTYTISYTVTNAEGQSATSVLTFVVVRSHLAFNELARVGGFPDCFPALQRPNLTQVIYEYKNVYAPALGQNVSLRAFVFYPPGIVPGTTALPAVAMFHGGGWFNGNPVFWFFEAAYLASRGYVTVAFQYRLNSVHGSNVEHSTADAVSAMRWLRKFAPKLGINPGAILTTGDSTGGHLALATALVDPAFGDEVGEDLGISSVPQGIFAAYPVLDTSWAGSIAASPIHRLGKGRALPPTMIIHGTADTLAATPYGTSANFCAIAGSLGSYCSVVPFAGQGHAFLPDPAMYTTAVTFLEQFGMALGFSSPVDPNTVYSWVQAAAPSCRFNVDYYNMWSTIYGFDLGGAYRGGVW